jgi:succinate dehydrogenase hydrophobic anchor subunit
VLPLVLLTVHMVAQHFVVDGGLRSYEQVVAWIRNPVGFATEALLLVCVTWHAVAGVHAVLLDLGLRGRAERIVADGISPAPAGSLGQGDGCGRPGP